jgi:hypothetical protein
MYTCEKEDKRAELDLKRIRNGQREEIKQIAESVKNNPIFNEIKCGEIPTAYQDFSKNIEDARYSKIRLLNLKTQARHKVAVLVKSIINR